MKIPPRLASLPYRQLRLTSHLLPSQRRHHSSSSFPPTDPLRILFCGSDSFSIASLRALHSARHAASIRSIDVVCRPDKRTGRGLTQITAPAIKAVAQQLSLPLHQIDTFTGWEPPQSSPPAPINLIVAVSFGLFVPPRILRSAAHGGLNVHPSLLPDLKGAAPVQHALLNGYKRTGVTVQTMDERHFDAGAVVAQTPAPGLLIPRDGDCTPAELSELLAQEGAAMLVDTIARRSFTRAHDLQDARSPDGDAQRTLNTAPKITKQDHWLDWRRLDAQAIVRRTRVLGSLWNSVQYHNGDGIAQETRVRWESWQTVSPEDTNPAKNGFVGFTTCDRPPRILRPTSCTLDSGVPGRGLPKLTTKLRSYIADGVIDPTKVFR